MAPLPPDDASLLRRAQRGDRTALEQLVSRHLPGLRRLALVRLMDPAMADDAVQDAVIRWMRALSKLDPGRPVGPFVRTLLRNACVDVQRRRTRRAEEPEVEGVTGPAVERDLDLHAGLRRVLEAMASLPERQRELVELCDRQGLRPREAAAELGISPSGARATLCEGRRALRRRLLADHPELADLVRAS